MTSETDLFDRAGRLLAHLGTRQLTVATAESCTGGLVSAWLTEPAGASAVFLGGVVSYSNEAKAGMLGVPMDTIEAHGAVSEPVARAMAEGVVRRIGADLGVAVTGVAGPGGGSVEKPVGLVHFAAAREGAPTLHRRMLFGDIGRRAIRLASVDVALALIERIGADGAAPTSLA